MNWGGTDPLAGSEGSEGNGVDHTMVENALSLSKTLSVDDLTPTSPEGSASATRYLGVLYASNLTPTPDRPFVLATLDEAHRLLAIAYSGGPVTYREFHAGAILETESRFPPNDEPELALWKMREDRPDFDIEYPDLIVKVGPKGGVYHERP